MQTGFLFLTWLSGAILMLAWWRSSGKWSMRLGIGLAAVAMAGVLAFRSCRNFPAGQLVWDGQEWRRDSPGYQSGTTAFDLVVLVDFQVMLLLRLQNQAGARLWLWVEKTAMPERWMDLRRAVYSRPASHAAVPFQRPAGPDQNVSPRLSVAVSASADSDTRPLKP